jgi:ABC-2 type transport system permease protein
VTATTTTTSGPVRPDRPGARIGARRAGFLPDLAAVATRALRQIPREPEAVIPAIIIPMFFFAVNVGALQDLAERGSGIDFKAFQLPVAIIFAVTGISRAGSLVVDIQSGYFDRLLLTPVSRLALLLGLMVADFALVVALCLPVIALGLVVGVDFVTGPLGIVAFVLLAGLWGLVFTGFPYAIALKTGNPAAVNTSFVLFFPFAFLTTSFLPKEALSGWLATMATYNPVTYLLEGLRSLITEGWVAAPLGKGLLAVAGVGLVSQGLALATLRGRVKRG